MESLQIASNTESPTSGAAVLSTSVNFNSNLTFSNMKASHSKSKFYFWKQKVLADNGTDKTTKPFSQEWLVLQMRLGPGILGM